MCEQLSAAILTKGKELGAALIGIVSIEELKKAPSVIVAPLLPTYDGVGAQEERSYNQKPGEMIWPQNMKSIVVFAYAHPETETYLDHWHGNTNPPGNKKLISISKQLIQWLQTEQQIQCFSFPYHVEVGGIYLKDAAVLAGIGCIGKNNLLLTPQYGSRVRLRAIATEIELTPTLPSSFDPCTSCNAFCINACPQKAFDTSLYSSDKYGITELPGRDGNFDRHACNKQMKIDEEQAQSEYSSIAQATVKIIKYCRLCEFTCPIGK